MDGEIIDALNLIKEVYLNGGNVEQVIDDLIVYFQGDYKGFCSLSDVYKFLARGECFNGNS